MTTAERLAIAADAELTSVMSELRSTETALEEALADAA